MIKGYIYSIQGLLDDNNNLVSDIFFINIDNGKTECLRCKNIDISFMIAKLPGQSLTEFHNFVTNSLKDYRDKITLKSINDFTDASYFNFDNKTEYIEIISRSPVVLNDCYKQLKNTIRYYYKKIDIDNLENSWDKIFYYNTENPFKFTFNSLNVRNTPYYISTKYNIPCIGGFTVKKGSWLEPINGFSIKELPRIHDTNIKIYTFDADGSKNLKYIQEDDLIDGRTFLKLMSYDIETYTQNQELKEKDKVIMCIGIGIFNILSQIPLYRYCITLKDFTKDDLENIQYTKTSLGYDVINEYSDGKPNDMTKYIIAKNEAQLLTYFISIISKVKPTYITGFNNYSFDDPYIWKRMNLYGKTLCDNLLQLFSWYNIDELRKSFYNKYLIPEFKDFAIKIDGEQYVDNHTWFGTSILSIDVYKIMLQSNAKLYTQQGRGTLDTMLNVNDVKNPFTGANLNKTGLSYVEMYQYWDENIKLYDIALYCCQDAWVAGTLLIKTSKLIDNIEMSKLTRTTVYDSFIKAVTHRIANIIANYAWRYKFAVMDKTERNIENVKPLGGKTYDSRTIKGGEVRSVKPGKQIMVTALDYSAMYPSQKEASNIDTSSKIPNEIIEQPENYGLRINQKVEILDMYSKRNIYYMSKNSSSEEYIVEQFFCEFKLDISEIKKCIKVINNTDDDDEKISVFNKLKELYPEGISDIENVPSEEQIPESVIKPIYCIQSPKDSITDKPLIHRSLKEIMLSDLRALRNSVKKELSNAEKEGNELEVIRFNAKQLAIKVVCNAEYGANGSKFFAYYDPIIAGSVTYASRMLIHFLSHVIESNVLYVDLEFLKKNKSKLDLLIKYKVIYIEKFNDRIPPRALSLRRLFDKYYNFIAGNNTYKVIIKPSTVIYQDTDSNYYINDYIKELFPNRTPENINETMNIMKSHNDIMGAFAGATIGRFPIALGFEAAKIISRYFNVKKKYYGIEWNEYMLSKLPDNNAYVNDILIPEYNKYWKAGISTLPEESGSYIYIDSEKLLNKRGDYLDYAHKQNLKVTGIDITRRDQYKFINFAHLQLIQNDMRLIKYIDNNNWENIEQKSLEEVINYVLDSFKNQINTIKNITYNMLNNINSYTWNLPNNMFKIDDYSKQVAYKPNKNNAIMQSMINRIQERIQNGDNIEMPKVFQRLNYVIVLTSKSKDLQDSGKNDDGKISEKAFMVDELRKICEEEIPFNKYNDLEFHDKYSYEQFIELLMISKLDFKHYMKSLCSSMANYALEYLDPEALKAYDDSSLTSEAKKNIITKSTDKITKLLLSKYFTAGKNANISTTAFVNDNKKIINKMNKYNNMQKYEELCKIIPSASGKTIEEIHKNKSVYMNGINNRLREYESNMNDLKIISKHIITNHFTDFQSSNSILLDKYNLIVKQDSPLDYIREMMKKYDFGIRKLQFHINYLESLG